MAELVRTFVAVEIPREVKDLAGRLIERLGTTDANVKWVKLDHLHWTLKFLGEVDLREIPAVCTAVEQAVAPFTPFDVVPQGAGAFPTPANPRTVWLGMGEGSDEMVALHDAIDDALGQIGYRKEGRRFRPHLTIGRLRQSRDGLAELARLLQENADFTGGMSTVYEAVIFSSVLGRQGPTYERLGHATLDGGG